MTSFGCSHVGTNDVALTAVDVNGNQATCTAKINVTGDDFDDDGKPNVCDSDDDGDGLKDAEDPCPLLDDKEPPTAVCQDVTIQLDAGGNGATTPTAVDNNSSDLCGIKGMTLDRTSFTCIDVDSANAVVLTVTDSHSNEANCSASVTVEDNIAPNVICSNITIELDSIGKGHAAASLIGGGTSDACGLKSMNASKTIFGCADVGSDWVTVTAIDVNGNMATCSSLVTIEDNQAPIMVCQDVGVQLDDSGVANITAAQVDHGSTDACGIASLSLDVDSFSFSELGANSVKLTAADINGNEATCTSIVYVADAPSSSPSSLPSGSPSSSPSVKPYTLPSSLPSDVPSV